MVAGMFIFVLSAMYSLYTAHQRAAYTSDETVEVQQNVRVALDSISRDIRIAGLLLPAGNTPISSGTSTMITISSGCPSAIITRITPSPSPQIGGGTPNTFTVDNDGSVSSFNKLDYVRIIRPTDKTQPGGIDRLYQVSATPVGNSITLTTKSGGDPVGVSFITGDVICKQTSDLTPAPPNTIQYYLGPGGVCPVGQQCLWRVDETGILPGDVIAQNMANNGLQFQYLLSQYPLPNETNAPTATNLGVIRAVRVTVTGQTAVTVALSNNVPKTRRMETLVQIRNP